MNDQEIKALVEELVSERLRELGVGEFENKAHDALSGQSALYGDLFPPSDTTRRDATRVPTDQLPEFAWMEPSNAIFDWRAGP